MNNTEFRFLFLIYISYINVPSMSWNNTIWAIPTNQFSYRCLSYLIAWYLKLPFTAENRNRPAQIITALEAKPTSWEVLNLKQFTNPSNCGAIVAGEALPGTQSKVGFCLVLRSQTLYLPLGSERVWWYQYIVPVQYSPRSQGEIAVPVVVVSNLGHSISSFPAVPRLRFTQRTRQSRSHSYRKSQKLVQFLSKGHLIEMMFEGVRLQYYFYLFFRLQRSNTPLSLNTVVCCSVKLTAQDCSSSIEIL